MDSPITCREHVPPDGGRVQSMRYSWSEPLLETKSWKQWKCPLQPPAELSVAYLLRFFSASSVPGELCHYVFQPFHLCVFELPTIRYLEVCTGCLHRLKTALCKHNHGTIKQALGAWLLRHVSLGGCRWAYSAPSESLLFFKKQNNWWQPSAKLGDLKVATFICL